MRFFALWILAFCFAISFPSLHSAEKGSAQKKPIVLSGERPDEKSLVSIVQEIEVQRKEVEERRKLLNDTKAPEERKAIFDQLTEEQDKLDELEHDFTTMAASVPYAELFGVRGQEFSVNKEVNDLLLPLLTGLKQATQQPRAIEMLKNSVQTNEDRLSVIEHGISNLEACLPTYEDEKNVIKPRLKALLAELKKEKLEVTNKITILRQQQEDLEERFSKRSIFASSTEIFRRYFRTRGWNLFLALLVFVVIFAGSRLLLDHLQRIRPVKKAASRSVSRRLLQVIYYGLTFVGAVLGALAVFYVQGDWALLSFAILFLAGAALAAKASIPRYYEHTRLLLNLGEVREGERVSIGGVPWRVESIGLNAVFTNPALTGGVMRLPLRQLGASISRPFDEKELWFPTREGDWVSLADGAWGKVVLQTPEMVQIVLLGGSRKTYSVPAFIAQNPLNLSTGFRVITTLGVDHIHQARVTHDIPVVLKESLQRDLAGHVDHAQILNLTVEFDAAADSSLQIYIAADFDGELAPRREQLHRLLQRLAVDACEKNGWKIPYPQMELHVPAV